MKRIKIEDTLYNVPESWDDVTLGQYEKWFDYVADTKMKEVELVSLISTIPFDLLSTLPLSFYTDVLNMQYFVNFQFIDSFIISYVINIASLTGTCPPVKQP